MSLLKCLTEYRKISFSERVLTKEVLQKQFLGAPIMEQVNIKMNGASLKADFLLVKGKIVIGIFKAKLIEKN